MVTDQESRSSGLNSPSTPSRPSSARLSALSRSATTFVQPQPSDDRASDMALHAAVLPAPLHLKVTRGSVITPSRASQHLANFLANPLAAPALAGAGGGATRVALVRLLEALKEEDSTKGVKGEKKTEGKKRKSDKSEGKEAKRRKVKEDEDA